MKLTKHSFKSNEWPDWVTKKILENYIVAYHRDFNLQKWNENTIRHFFQINIELYNGNKPEFNQLRCIATILGVNVE